MDVNHIRLQHLISFQGVLPALYKIGEIEYGLKMISVKCLHDLQTAGGHVAVDLFLIFVKKYDIADLGVVSHLPQTVHYLVLRHEEAEHADIIGLHNVSDLHGVFIQLHVRPEWVGNPDLSDRGTYGRQADPFRIQLFFNLLYFLNGIFHQPFSVDAPHLHVAHSQFL